MNARAPQRTWLQVFTPRPAAELRLFCLPYAGGGAGVYRHWGEQLPAAVELGAVRLPGREGRFGEPPLRRLDRLIELLVDELLPLMDRRFALFGHSLGALVAFELARALRRGGHRMPAHLFVSGRRAPQLASARDPGRPVHLLPDAELLAELGKLEGAPPRVAGAPELLELMLPTVRADFEMGETYRFAAEAPLALPITGFGGEQDGDVSADSVAAWQAQTTGRFAMHLVPGGHFFLHDRRDAVLEPVAAELAAVVQRGARA